MYKIAFFGSDLFSLASFKEVLKLHRSRPGLVQSLSLVTRQLKVSGRGMKNIHKPEIVEFAEAQNIDWYQIESPKEFDSLSEISNLAVAVSYGRLIPGSYLKSLTYGGLNVHPSLLPQYRGASPLQYAIMDQQKVSGVSVQTLHPTKFDHGKVIWQSDPVALSERESTASLSEKLGQIGAEGLVWTLENVDLLTDEDKLPSVENSLKSSRAPMIDRALYRIDLTKSSSELDSRGRALGKLFFEQRVEQKQPKRGKIKGHPILRVNLSKFKSVDSLDDTTPNVEDLPIGTVISGKSNDGETLICVKVADGFLGAAEATVQGFKVESAQAYFDQREKRKLRETVLPS